VPIIELRWSSTATTTEAHDIKAKKRATPLRSSSSR